MQARIETLAQKRLAGIRMSMSFSNDGTKELWQQFMPRRKEIVNATSNDLYSVEVYKTAAFFDDFDPHAGFDKWAAIEVSSVDWLPHGMECLVLPAGLYAVFIHRGRAIDGPLTYNYIFGTWLPGSAYALDNRPHFAVMGEKYKQDDAASEEEIWIPVKL